MHYMDDAKERLCLRCAALPYHISPPDVMINGSIRKRTESLICACYGSGIGSLSRMGITLDNLCGIRREF